MCACVSLVESVIETGIVGISNQHIMSERFFARRIAAARRGVVR